MSQVPMLKRSVDVGERNGAVVLEHLLDELTLEGDTAELFRRMEPHLDGCNDLQRLAELAGAPAERLGALAQRLAELGVVAFRDADDAPPMDGKAFYALHRKYCRHWLRPVNAHPLWDEITAGLATRAQVIGFAFEKYHYIEAAYEHMGIAAANATPELMPHLARHFIEEYTHGDIYRRGLATLFPDALVGRSQPLPSTRALINFLNESAARNSFSYYAGNELLQMTENTRDADEERSINDFYAAMGRHYPYAEKLIESFEAHTRLDQNLGHEDAFFEMCGSVPPLTAREVRDAMNTTRSMAEHLVLFMDGIREHYAAFPEVPRAPCTLASE